MTFPLDCPHRLVGRGEAGVACDEDGIALGAVHLVRASRSAGPASRCEVRSLDEIDLILRTAYGPQPAGVAARVYRRLCRAAAWIEAGDLGRAGVETVGLGLPEIGPETMAKLNSVADLEKAGVAAWRTEPRVPAGQPGGGQWTTGSGGAGGTAEDASDCADAYSHLPIDSSLLVHVNTAAAALGTPAAESEVNLPFGATAMARAGVLVLGATLLHDWGVENARQQLGSAITRFGLDPTRRNEVMAATAYVWAIYNIAPVSNAPNNGPALDAAAQAVMRYVLMNPDVLVSKRPDQKSYNMIIQVANAGVADYLYQSARPKGVDRKYQTTSASARAAVIAETEMNKDVAVHHLIPANVWKDKLYLVQLAEQAGWTVNDQSNLIQLPRNPVQQARMGGVLPIHNASHGIYDRNAMGLIEAEEAASPKPITPEQAREILTNVCVIERARIIGGYYGEFMRASV